MFTRRFDIDLTPLSIASTFGPEDSVPASQVYDGVTYTPDYTLVPLTLRLKVLRYDKDHIVQEGICNRSLTNLRFYEIIGGTQTAITASTQGYTITTSGDEAGTILVAKNSNPATPTTIVVEADLPDPRDSSQYYHIRHSYLLQSVASTAPEPTVEVDIMQDSVYNPLRDPHTVVLNAAFNLGSSYAALDSHLAFKWYKRRETVVGNTVSYTYTEYGTAPEDIEGTISGTCGQLLTLDRSLMGEELNMRVYGFRDPAGTPSTTPGNDTPMLPLSMRRQVPAIDFAFGNVPYNVPQSTETVSPVAHVEDAKGLVTPVEPELTVLWYRARNTSGGSVSYEQIAVGENASGSDLNIPISDIMDTTWGCILALDVTDAGPRKIIADTDGLLIADSDSALIMAQ